MFKPASGKFSLVLVLAALLVFAIYSWLNMHRWQQELRHKLKQLDMSTATENQSTTQDNQLLISDIALPQTPKRAAPVLATSNQPTVIPVVTELQNPAPSPSKLVVKLADKAELKTPSQPSQEPSPVTKPEPKQEPRQEQTAAQVYAQLQADNSLDLQIALPASPAKQQQLLNYFYRCAAVQFAVLQQQQLSYLSPQRYVPVSQWLRVANGSLSKQEQQWLAQQNGIPIRIFPQTIDQSLAQYIATNLNGTKLSSLRANYSLTPSGLALSNITLNNQRISSNWLLHHSQCTA